MMSEKENVDSSKLIMFINDRTIDIYDTVESLDLHIADIIGVFYLISCLHILYIIRHYFCYHFSGV